MESKEYQNDGEMVIDIAHFAVSILKKWRSLVMFVIIGALLGAALQWVPQWMPQKEAPTRSREDAALVEKMKVAVAARNRYENLKRYTETSPFMQLDSQNVFTGNSEYYVSACEDPDQIDAAFCAIIQDKAVRDDLCGILGLSDEMDLDKLVSLETWGSTVTKIVGDMKVELEEKISMYVTVYAQTQEQAQQALDYLDAAVAQLPQTMKSKQQFELVEITKAVQHGAAPDLRQEQSDILEELTDAYFYYMEDLEEDFSEKEYAVYAEYFLTGKTDELPLVLFPGNPLKKPVIVAFLFAFLACGWYAAAYFFSGKVKTADEMAALTRKNVLGFVNESAPRKCFIDRWLDGLESHSFPTSVSAAYVSAAAAKLGRAVVVYDENDADLQEIVREMSIPCLGLLGQNPNTLNRVQKDDQVVLLVKLGTTTKMQVQREAALCAQYGISLAGSILVK